MALAPLPAFDRDRTNPAAPASVRPDLGHALDAHRPALLAVAAHRLPARLRTKGDPADLVQDTLLDAWARFETFRGGSAAELAAWLARILAHRLAKFDRAYRTHKRCQTREVLLADVSLPEPRGERPGGSASRGEAMCAVRDAVARLADPVRVVVVLRHWEQLSFAEVAERTGRSEAAVRKTWARAVARLRAELGTFA